MTTVENIREQLLEMAENRDRWDLVELWNTYCDENSYFEDRIQYNDIDEMEDYFDSIADFYHAMDNYNEFDDFFIIDGYGCLQSFDKLTSTNSPVDFDSLAEWLLGDALRCRQYDIEIDDDDELEEED